MDRISKASARSSRALAVAAALAMVSAAVPAQADLFGGGGSKKTDCLLILDTPVNHPAANPKKIRCTDGDVSCDADGIVNGVCEFPTAACANSTFDPSCTLVGLASVEIEHAEDNGDPKFDTNFQALQDAIDGEFDPPNSDPDVCTNFITISVPIKGPLPGKTCRRGKKKMKIESRSVSMMGKRFTDRDKLQMQCLPDPTMCLPTVIFSGTLDRLQRQIFTPTCAIGGCHESQSVAGNLLLESGTSHGALVDVDSSNGAAFAAGLKRVDSATGDANDSFLFLKLEGDLQTGMGDRMPFGAPKLTGSLRDLVQLWIEAGAPETGWVAGTDQ